MISYSPPSITDHGSLVDLTADFDLTFVGSVAKVVSLAAVSPAVGGLIPGGETPNPSGPGGGAETVNVLSGGGSGGGGSPDLTGDGPTVRGDAGAGAPGPSAPGGAGDVAGAGAGGGGGSGGGNLPFTGFYVTASAAAGAALTTAGVALRSKLRRKS